MPTYEYRCKACGHQLEAVQAFSDNPLTRCASCGAEELRKVFGAVGISFKGSGFYKTDSRTKSSVGSKSKSDGDKAGSSTSSDSSSKTDSSGKTGSSDKSGSPGSKTKPAPSNGSSDGSSDGGSKKSSSNETKSA